MKYLLKQQIRLTRKGIDYYIHPNKYTSSFIKLARKNNIDLEEKKTWNGKYYVTEYYIIKIGAFNFLKAKYKELLEKKRQEFYNQDPLVQLVQILRYIFTRNNRAKEVSKYSASQKAYGDKNQFLKIALDIAKKITSKDFSYGYQEDPSSTYHQIIYYFQLGNKQVSFHCDRIFPETQKFPGSWIGYRNERYPFNLNEAKSILNITKSHSRPILSKIFQ